MKSSIAHEQFDESSESTNESNAGLPDPDRASTGTRQCNGWLLRSLFIDDPFTREAAAEPFPAWRYRAGVYEIPGASPEMQAAVAHAGSIVPRFYDPGALAVERRHAEEDRQRVAAKAAGLEFDRTRLNALAREVTARKRLVTDYAEECSDLAEVIVTRIRAWRRSRATEQQVIDACERYTAACEEHSRAPYVELAAVPSATEEEERVSFELALFAHRYAAAIFEHAKRLARRGDIEIAGEAWARVIDSTDDSTDLATQIERGVWAAQRNVQRSNTRLTDIRESLSLQYGWPHIPSGPHEDVGCRGWFYS